MNELFNRYTFVWFKIGLVITYLAISFWALENCFSLPIYVDIIFFLLFIDFKNVLNLKNYYLVYVFLIFKLSSGFWFEDDYKLPFDGTLYFVAFLLGYEIKNVLIPKTYNDDNRSRVDVPLFEQKIVALEFLLKIFVVLKIFYLLILIAQYGVVTFYSGQMLADKISNYGKKSVLDSILTIYSAFVDNFIIAIVVLYVRFKSALKQNPNYYYIGLALLVLPLLILSRSTFAFNVVTVMAIYGYFSKSLTKVYYYLIPGAIILLSVTLYIGFLRLNSYNSGEDLSNVTSGDQFFTELTPILSYKGVKDNIQVLKYQHGKTILLPLATKVIPRSMWTTKPENSSAYYNREFDYMNFAAGFSIPLMIFGDLYLNFGMIITLILIFLLGVYIAYLNNIYVNKLYRKIDFYLIIFICFYSLLRNNLPESIITILLILFSKVIIEKFFLSKTSRNQSF